MSLTASFAAPPCDYSLSPASASVAASGGSGNVAVTTSSTCAWTATANVDWITITSGAVGTGSGAVGYSVAANTGGTSRTGSLTIAGQTFTVTQGASEAPTGAAVVAPLLITLQ